MKDYYLERGQACWGSGGSVCLYFGTHRLDSWCYRPFIKKFPQLKLKPGEKIPVDIKITRRK